MNEICHQIYGKSSMAKANYIKGFLRSIPPLVINIYCLYWIDINDPLLFNANIKGGDITVY